MILSNYSQGVESTENNKSRHTSFQVGFKYLDYDHCSNLNTFFIFWYCPFKKQTSNHFKEQVFLFV